MALRAMAQAPIRSANRASAAQTQTQRSRVVCRAAIHAAASAVTPAAICPLPETAVKEPARSMALRMKERLSIARRWMGRGLPGGVRVLLTRSC